MNKVITIALIVSTVALSAAPLAHASTANVQPDRSSWGSAPSTVAPDGAKWENSEGQIARGSAARQNPKAWMTG